MIIYEKGLTRSVSEDPHVKNLISISDNQMANIKDNRNIRI